PRPPDFHIATPATRLQTSIPPRCYIYIEPPELHTSMPPRRYTNIAPLELHPSILHVGLRFATPSCGALCGARANLIKTFQLPEQLEQTPSKFHAYTPTVCLQSSRARLASSRTPTSTSARLHRASRAPELLEATR